jgi:hypothetical protein
MEELFLRKINGDAHPRGIELLRHALEAITGWTSLAASIAADTALELARPESQPFSRRHPFQLGHIGIVFLPDCARLLAHQQVMDQRHALRTALATLFELTIALYPTASQAHDVNPRPIYLLFVKKDIERARVAGFDQYPHPRGRLPPLHRVLELVQVDGQVVGAAVIPDQVIYLLRIIDEGRAGLAPRPLLIANEADRLLAL